MELEAQIAAYRHAIKDIARETDPEKMREACIRALDDEQMRELGRKFHFVIKAAVQLDKAGREYDAHAWEDAKEELWKRVEELPKHSTVRGWEQ